MQLDFSALSPLDAYRWLASSVTPRPIAWVSSRSPEGVANLAPFSFFQVISDNPPTLLVNVNTRDDGSLKDTLRNAQASGELAIQLVSFAQAEAMNASAAVLPHEISEFEHYAIASVPCERIDVPRVVGAPVTFECRVAQIQPYRAAAQQSPDLRRSAAGPYRRRAADRAGPSRPAAARSGRSPRRQRLLPHARCLQHATPLNSF